MQTPKSSLGHLIFITILSSFALSQEPAVSVRGASSMLMLGQKVVAFYGSEYPGSTVAVNVSESPDQLPSGTTTIWQSVHPVTPAEKRALNARFGSAPRQIPIAIQGVLVIVNKHNSVQSLSVDQLRSIYLGKITNWKDLGGSDERILLYSTESLAGGSLFFRDLVLRDEEINDAMRGYVNPKETAEAVAAEQGAIGLTPVAGDARVKYLQVRRASNSPAIAGSSENVRSLAYPLSTYLYWSFSERHGPAISQFVQFTLSSRGQMAIEASGYYPLNPSERNKGMFALAMK